MCKIKFCLLLLLFIRFSNFTLAQFSTDLTGNKVPWTGQPIVQGNNFRFIVAADRSGGERKGVFKQALNEINKYNPDFVVSVGDLIDGYTTDSALINSQWGEFQMSLRELTAPFFYTAGNHDYSNNILARFWKNSFGYSYYHFKVADALFLVLNTEEIVDGRTITMSQAQSDYMQKAIENHKVDAPIFVIMHTPIWKGENMKQYIEIEHCLRGRNVTVFSGHNHKYLMITKNQQDHYVLATMGGDSNLRGVYMGEFDHFLIVDVTGNKVKVKNRLVSGEEISCDVVNAETVLPVELLSNADWFTVKPTTLESRFVHSIQSNVTFENRAGYPIEITPCENRIASFELDSEKKTFILNPKSSKSIPVKLRSFSEVDIDDFQPLSLSFNGKYVINGKTIQAICTSFWTVDYPRTCSDIPLQIRCQNPQYVQENWDWHSVEDGWFEFSVCIKNEQLHIEIMTHDDKLITNPDKSALQDRLFVYFRDDSGNSKEIVLTGGLRESGLSCTYDDGCLHASICVNLGKANNFNLNIGFMDCDNTTNIKPSILWWKPLAEDKVLNESLGLFRLQR